MRAGPSRRPVGILVLVAVVAGLLSLGPGGTFALKRPRPRYRSAAQLPALRSAAPRRPRVQPPRGDSSSRRHRAVIRSGPGVVLAADTAPPATTASSPASDSTVTTNTPTLSVNAVTDPDGDPVTYRFKVTTKPDAETGTIVADTAVASTSFTVPDGALKDGGVYWWHVYTADPGHPAGTAPGWVRAFKVDLRLGSRPVYPFDSAGPVAVNLASGNLVVGASSASVASLGGPIGVSFAYNSQAPSQPGLIGSYTSDPNGNHVVDGAETPTVVRRDPSLAFDWSGGSPSPGLPSTKVIGRWTGYVTAPAGGSYQFGAAFSDGARVAVGGSTVLDAWTTPSPTAPVYGTTSTLAANTPAPITVDWFKGASGNALLKLYVKDLATTPPTESLVPASWLSSEAPAMPTGWMLTPSGGGGLGYVRAEVSDSKVVLVAPDGVTHTFTSTGTGYTPPAGEDGVLTRDDQGLLTLLATDGTTYVFGPAGTLQSATSSSDSPTATRYTWTTPSGFTMPRLTKLTDPVSGRDVTIRYGGDASCPSSPPSGFDTAAPVGMACSVGLWDGRVTKLWYVGGRLGRIENPGAAVTDFAYDSAGRIVKLRDPLAADMVAASLRSDDDTTRTLVTYDSSGRVASVTLGKALATDASRPARTYAYTSATETRVHVAGLAEALGWARKVTLDGSGRLLTDTDATGRSSSIEWDAADDVVASVDAAGLKTTTFYDWAGRPTDTFGPAPAAWFDTDRLPAAAHAAEVPHASRAYDAAWHGLDVMYFPNQSLAGQPVAHVLGPDPSGRVYGSWTSTPPVPGLTATNWSARMTGELLLPTAGTYSFAPNSGGRTRMYLDDVLVVDTSNGPTGTYANAVAGTRHRLRVEFVPGAFSYSFTPGYTSPGTYSWTVPTGVSSVTVEARGASGGSGLTATGAPGPGAGGGAGGRVRGTFSVSAGQSMSVLVGGAGGSAYASGYCEPIPEYGVATTASYGGAGGYGGGGAGDNGQIDCTYQMKTPPGGGGGGGRSEVSLGGSTLLVAGGGGGGGGALYQAGGAGGGGGAESGANGGNASCCYIGGFGGTQSGPGNGGHGGGSGTSNVPYAGSGRSGGSMANSYYQGGGGGGGYYGGGSGGNSSGGGGGSSYVSGANTLSERGVQWGSGQVTLTYTQSVSQQVDLHWTPPGGTDQQLPGADVFPRYGLVTASTDADGRAAATEYADPALALPTAAVVDPSGLNLRTTTTYEAAGASSLLRPLTRTLPKGAATAVTTAYYGATETRANPCVGGSPAVNQGGLAKTATSADPDGAGSQAPRIAEQVHDAAGRVIATRVQGDSSWSCATYDDRDRPLTSVDRAGGATTWSYAVAGTVTSTAPDSGGTSRTTSTVVDLLGRPVRTTDELGTQHRTVYDQAGRAVATHRTFAGEPESQLTSTTFDDAGRPLTQADHLTGSARTSTVAYDAAGRVWSVTRPNGIVTSTTYDALGRVVALEHLPSGASASQSQVFSYTGALQTWTVPSGVTSLTIDARGASGGSGLTGTDAPGSGAGGGAGGRARGTFSVSAGQSVSVLVGGAGGSAYASGYCEPIPEYGVASTASYGGAGGYGGGGAGDNGQIDCTYQMKTPPGGGGGGGRSEVTVGGSTVVVAGGGGGGGGGMYSQAGGVGGAGGAESGASGGNSGSYVGGFGGTQSGPGNGGHGGGSGTSSLPYAGSGRSGGSMANSYYQGGGGGGGYYGGGSGGTSSGGGGGSNYLSGAATDVVSQRGVQGGHGQVTLTWPTPVWPLLRYQYSLGGRTIGEANANGSSRSYTFDGAGRLTTVVEGATTRRYSYDADSNRCGLAASCQSGWTYDNADRITASPYASAYVYDGHGNVTGTTGTSGNPSAAISYDANDHATVTNDGTRTTTETLMPSGRVLRRRVVLNATSAVEEDVVFGYAGGGDSPAYSMPYGGGAVTTFLGDLTDVDGVPTWSLYDLRGSVVGTTTAAGALTAVSPADEFGTGGGGTTGHYGWLGQHQRPTTGGGLGLVRMGVRLYDPRLGRFLEVDPVFGGSCNDYDYVCGDPVNGVDLTGTMMTPDQLTYGDLLADPDGFMAVIQQFYDDLNSAVQGGFDGPVSVVSDDDSGPYDSRVSAQNWLSDRASDVGKGLAKVGSAVGGTVVKVAHKASCVAGQMLFPPTVGSVALEAGASIGGGGALAVTMGAAGVAVGAGALVIGTAFVVYGGYKIYQACRAA